ncbi:MAG TPA: ABC transporter substrate-binding protein [Methylomirabilota bacterium]|nr:ABC transporter substrate-binding protein [Methylomirabilota bacterium]
MDRRTFLTGVAAALTGVDTACAQPVGKVARIGRLSPLSAAAEAPFMAAFRAGLRELGWVEGQSFTIESRFADGKAERLAQLAADLVRRGVDVVLVGSNPGALAAKQATRTIPIVMVTTGDPVGGGIVASLARPEGNVTGLTALGQALSAKRLEALKEAVPGVTRVAVLANPTSLYTPPFLKEQPDLVRELGVQLLVLEADDPGRLPKVFATLVAERAGALMVLSDVMLINHRRQIVDLAASHRVPALYPERGFVDVGGLMFYGASLVDLYRRAAAHVDKVLKGARPGELPVEQPTKFELVLNAKTARVLGLTFPHSLVLRADQVLQ